MAQDPKSRLTRFLQRKIGRSLSKQDLSYSVERYEEGCQATLYLPCLADGTEFVGEVGQDAKEAEQLAAAQALETYIDEVEALAAEAASAPKKQRRLEDGTAAPRPMEAVDPVDNPKQRLNTFLMKFMGRTLSKEDFSYETVRYDEGYQSTVTLNCLDGDSFVGELAQDAKEAERNAAQIVLETYHDQVLEAESRPRAKELREVGKVNSLKGKGCIPLRSGAKGGCYPQPPSLPPQKGKLISSSGKGGSGKWQAALGPSQPMYVPHPAPYMPCKGGWRPYEDPYAYAPMYGKAAPKGGKGVVPAARTLLKPVAPRKLLTPTLEAKPRAMTQETCRSQLNTFLQRSLGRPVVKDDIEILNEKIEDDRFQVTVTLHSLNGEVYTAEAATEKEAVELACRSALDEHAAEIEALPPSEKKRKRAKEPTAELAGVNHIPLGGLGEQTAADEAKLASLTNKSDLNSLVMKLNGRALNKGDIRYECTKVPEGGFQAVVTIECLLGPDGESFWSGEVCETKQKAEQSAAGLAYEILMAMPENVATLQEREEIKAAERIERQRQREEKGKGKGKVEEEDATVT